MGNPSSKSATKLKNQAPSIQFSVNITNHTEFGSSSNEHKVDTINIELEKVNLDVSKQAKVGNYVKLKLKYGVYEVLLENQIIGYVPEIYTPFLMPNTQNSGYIVSVKNEPILQVIIQVQKYIK